MEEKNEQRSITIVALGDSTTAGTPNFLSPLESPPHGKGDEKSQFAYWLEQKHPNWRVLNRGIDGQRSDEIRQRFERDVLRAEPRLAIIIAGVNDVYQGYSVAHVKEQLEGMYSQAQEGKLSVVAGSILPYNTSSEEQQAKIAELNSWIKKTAESRDFMAFCDTNRAVRNPENVHQLLESPDGLHPNAEGYRKMAVALMPVISSLLT